MKTCLTILLSLLCCSMAQSQYRYLRNYDDDVHAIIPCQDSTYYTISIHPGCGINSFSVHYIGRHGQLIWSKESQTWVSHLNDFKGFTDENNVLTLIYSSLGYNGLTRMDQTGTIIFNRIFNSSTYRMNSIIPTTGGFYLTGIQYEYTSDPSIPVLLKMDNSGQVVWVKSYSIPNIPRLLFRDVQMLGDSLLMVGNYTEAGSPEVTFPYILKTDLNGNTGSSNYYRIETIDVDRYKFLDVDSHDPASIYLKFYASSGVDGILKLNNQLQPVWCKSVVGDLGTICASYEGGVMFSTGMSFDGDITNLNPQGTIIGSTATGNLSTSSLPSVILRHDCGYLVALPSTWPGDRYAHISQDQLYCGASAADQGDLTPINTVTKHPISVNTQTLASSTFSLIILTGAFTDVIRTETVDCIEPYSCSGPLGLSEQQWTSDLLYPNPATDVIHIETKDSPIVITNATGAVVYSGTLTNNELNIRFLAPGLYHVNCSQQSGHFIKQ